jgi:hypothetical protein
VTTAALAGCVWGCAVVPRERFDESQRLAQTLRAENARLKDQVVSLQAQNRDAGDRALDDLRRLTARDEAIGRLERSVEAYREDRDRLAAAYERVTTGLGRTDDSGAPRQAANAAASPAARHRAVRADYPAEPGPEVPAGNSDGPSAPPARGDVDGPAGP